MQIQDRFCERRREPDTPSQRAARLVRSAARRSASRSGFSRAEVPGTARFAAKRPAAAPAKKAPSRAHKRGKSRAGSGDASEERKNGFAELGCEQQARANICKEPNSAPSSCKHFGRVPAGCHSCSFAKISAGAQKVRSSRASSRSGAAKLAGFGLEH